MPCAEPFSRTKNEGKLFLVPKFRGPLLAGLPLKCRVSWKFTVTTLFPSQFFFNKRRTRIKQNEYQHLSFCGSSEKGRLECLNNGVN